MNNKKTSKKNTSKRHLSVGTQRTLAILSILGFALVIVITGICFVQFTNILGGSLSSAAQGGVPSATPGIDVTPNPLATPSPTPQGGFFDDIINLGRPVQTNTGDKEKKRNFYTFLICGTDIDNTRTDAVLICQYDITNQKLKILQVPRDTYIDSTHYDRKLTTVHAYEGMDGMLDAIKRTLGIEIDYYFKIKLGGFRDIVDVIGGVEVYVDYDLDYDDPDQNLHIHLKKGLQTLDGKKAEQYVRYRHGYANGDIGRMNAQRKFIKAFMTQAFTMKNITKIPELIDKCLEMVDTNASFTDLTYFGTSALSLDMENITIYTAPGEPSYRANDPHSYFTLFTDDTIKLISENFNPYTTDFAISDFQITQLTHNSSISETDDSGKSFGDIDETAPKPK